MEISCCGWIRAPTLRVHPRDPLPQHPQRSQLSFPTSASPQQRDFILEGKCQGQGAQVVLQRTGLICTERGWCPLCATESGCICCPRDRVGIRVIKQRWGCSCSSAHSQRSDPFWEGQWSTECVPVCQGNSQVESSCNSRKEFSQRP